MAFLDESGLAHFWEKVKAALSGKQNVLTAGDGLSKEGDTLGVDTPVRSVCTQEEYDALPEEQRNKGLYVIPGTGGGGSGGGSSSGEVYSTEETRIGTWIDGKPIYRKVAIKKNVNTPIIAYGIVASVNVESLDALVNSTISASYVNGGQGVRSYQGLIAHIDEAAPNTVFAINNALNTSNNINFSECKFILEYTKTTDQPEVSA